ncbi:hypothetical protein [Paracoccus simplex]|uniref:Lipoprotein n=1 Tax=Paracoccus simplex TaxID=2086346 RepID=A0ABV7RY04_9RHOB
MSLAKICGALALAALAACSDDTSDYPALMPTDRLLAPPSLPGHAADAANDPEAATAALDARAQGLAGRAGSGQVDNDAELRRRAEALRARARALSERPLDDCTPDDADCAPEAAPN